MWGARARRVTVFGPNFYAACLSFLPRSALLIVSLLYIIYVFVCFRTPQEEWRRRAHALETKLSFLEQRLEQEVDRCLRAEARIEELEGQFGEGAFRPLSPGAGPDVAMVEDEFLERLASAETEVDGLRAQVGGFFCFLVT